MSGTAPGEFTPGMYIREGITITSRGCIRKCPWCLVPEREGAIRTLRIHPGNIIQDNNLLACPDDHVRKVFAMLRGQHAIEFKGGLDARLLRQWHVEEMRRLKIKEMWFAADDDAGVEMLDKISLRDWRRDQKRAYVLAGFGGDTIDEAECRARRVWWAGFLPYMQFYRGKDEQDFTRPWRDLVALWCQPKLTKDHMKAKP